MWCRTSRLRPTYAITLLNVPALSLPVGFTRAGLPIGLQVASIVVDQIHFFCEPQSQAAAASVCVLCDDAGPPPTDTPYSVYRHLTRHSLARSLPVQIVAKSGRDDLVVRVAAYLERLLALDMKPSGRRGGASPDSDQVAADREPPAHPKPHPHTLQASPARVLGPSSVQGALRHHALTCPLLKSVNLKE